MDGEAFRHDELPTVWANIRRLCQLTTIFPSPDQMIWHGNKLAVVRELAIIAREHTRTPYPKIVPIKDPSNIDFKNKGLGNLYVKREFSECGYHVLKVADDREFKKQFLKQVKETDKLYDHESIRKMGIHVHWFCMSYVDGLQSLGELRVFLVGGIVCQTMMTQVKGDGEWDECAVGHVTPLRLIEQVLPSQ